ncbi:hypothetical protein LINGRAHAP2_LOCUS5887 [Linum grandiflorum]
MMAEGEITHHHFYEVASFCELLDWNWMVKVEHLYRKGNREADYLADHDHSLPIGVYSISISDPTLSIHNLYDLLEIS